MGLVARVPSESIKERAEVKTSSLITEGNVASALEGVDA
jgi:hypothetical protein